MPHKKNHRNPIHAFNRITGQPSRMNGKRGSKSSHPNDFFHGTKGHTQPVEFTCADDTGVRDPSRRRHRQTKIMRQQRKAEAALKDNAFLS
jgi:hypothetical protein